MLDISHLGPSAGPRILIADDEVDFRAILTRRAVRLGLIVDEANDGHEAMSLLHRNVFDVLVTDLYMPGLSGLEVIKLARKKDPDLQSIVFTGSATIETAIEALRVGAFDYLMKPLETLAEFDLSLQRALEHRFLLRENARLFAEVQRLAVTDALTGLYNRRRLNEILEAEMERARRYVRPLSLIMLDLDNLKRVNDAHGHAAGDRVLVAAAQAMQRRIRKVDLPTRYGGDEFVIVLPEASLEVALKVAQDIVDQIALLPFQDSHVTACAGVAQWDPAWSTREAYLKVVDTALYEAKRSGVGSVRAKEASEEGVDSSPTEA